MTERVYFDRRMVKKINKNQTEKAPPVFLAMTRAITGTWSALVPRLSG